MSRLFLTNIDLNQNELQNAVIQNLSSAPSSGNTEGRIYYDNTRKTLRVWRNDSLQGAKWYDLSVGGTSASTVTLTGDVTGSASVDPVTGIITLDTHLNVSGTTNQIVVNDIGNTTTISLPDLVVIENGEIQVQKTSYWRDGSQQGIIAAQSDGSLRLTGIANGLQLETNSGLLSLTSAGGNDININSGNNVSVNAGLIQLTSNNVNVGGGGTNGVLTVQDSNGVNVLVVNSDVPASGLSYHGYNSYTSTKTVDINGFIQLSSEGNAPTGYLYVNANTEANEAAPTLHLESKGDLALRAGANGNEGNIILYTGETSSGQPGKAYIGWGNSRYGADAEAEIATIGTTQTFSNKTLVSPTLNGPVGITDGSGNVVGNLNGDSGTLEINGTSGDIAITADSNLSVTAGTSTFSGNVNINGNLNVQGTLTAINKTEIDISDNTLVLNSNVTTGTPSQDAAIQVKRGSANTVGIVWSEGNQDWTLTNDGNNYFGIARKAVFAIGDASNTSFDVVHNLGTQDITVAVRMNNSDYELVETDVKMKDVNTVTIAFTDAPALNAYKVIIVG